MRRLTENTTCLADIEAADDLTEERIAAVAAPALALYSDRSPFLGVCRYLEQHLPRCRSVVESEGDHFFPALAPEALANLLLEFLASVDAAEMDREHTA